MSSNEVSYHVSLACEIKSIDDVEQTFEATGYVWCSWTPFGESKAKLVESKDEDLNYDDFKSECIYTDAPDLLFSNAITTEVTDTTMSKEEDRVCAQFGYNTVVGEAFDLRNFPFDRQILEVDLANQNVAEGKSIKFLPNSPAKWVTLLGALSTNWKFGQIPKLGLIDEPGSEGSRQVALRIYLERKPMYFFWKVIFPLFIITSTMLTSWLFEVDEFDSRISVLLTLLLTATAFQYVTTSYLPKTPYLTLLDKYVCLCFLLLFISIIETGTVFIVNKSIDHANTITYIDRVFVVVLSALWCLFHVVFFTLVFFKRLFKSWEKVEKQRGRKRETNNYVDIPVKMEDFTGRGTYSLRD